LSGAWRRCRTATTKTTTSAPGWHDPRLNDSGGREQPGLAATYTLGAEGITVEVTTDPYGFEVRNGAGDVVLSSVTGDADGHGPAAWTSGSVGFQRFLSPGYVTMYPALDPWRDRFRVASAFESQGSLALMLSDTQDAAAGCVEVTHTVRASALRVEAVAPEQSPRAWAAGFTSPADEGFLGFGERFNEVDQRGHDVFAWSEEAAWAPARAPRRGRTTRTRTASS
jgi:hypothetical protein